MWTTIIGGRIITWFGIFLVILPLLLRLKNRNNEKDKNDNPLFVVIFGIILIFMGIKEDKGKGDSEQMKHTPEFRMDRGQNSGGQYTQPTYPLSGGGFNNGSNTHQHQQCTLCGGTGICRDRSQIITSTVTYCLGNGWCAKCGGNGCVYSEWDPDVIQECYLCHGFKKCQKCKGTGKCQRCGGTGYR